MEALICPHSKESLSTDVSARIVGKARVRARRGGVVPWEIARQGVLNHLREDQRRYVSTMVDYYAMPDDWPGRSDASVSTLSPLEKAGVIGLDIIRGECPHFRDWLESLERLPSLVW